MKRFRQNETAAMAEILRRNGVISVPTDTVYGVCARMSAEAAQEQLRKVKNRPADKAFPLMCKDAEEIETIAETDARSRKLIAAFMPGPVTLILKKKPEVPAFVNGGMTTIAVRMATSEPVRRLIETLGEPVYMTSANQSGHPVSTSLAEIEASGPLLDGMREGSPSFGQASTIIDCTGEEIRILRPGPVTMNDIEQVLKQ